MFRRFASKYQISITHHTNNNTTIINSMAGNITVRMAYLYSMSLKLIQEGIICQSITRAVSGIWYHGLQPTTLIIATAQTLASLKPCIRFRSLPGPKLEMMK